MELRDDLAEARRRQVGEVVLELRERARRELGLRGARDEIDGRVALEERIDAPGVLVGDHVQRLDALRLEVARHAQDVALQEVGRKDVRVDALEDEARAARRLDLERVVDVSRAVARDVRDAVDAHQGERVVKFFLRIGAV